LKATGGVYLLVHRERAHLYVGSATGGDGFFGRWRRYQNGHGGNVGLLSTIIENRGYPIMSCPGTAVSSG
jgi:hypothetical protein